MTKIEEITALLIDEISLFNKSIKRLEIEREKIENVEIRIDTSEINDKFYNILDIVKEENKDKNDNIKSIKNELSNASIFPRWIVILYSLLLAVFLVSFSLNFYQYQETKKIKKTAYELGKSNIRNQMQLFFDDNPNALKQFTKWNKKR